MKIFRSANDAFIIVVINPSHLIAGHPLLHFFFCFSLCQFWTEEATLMSSKAFLGGKSLVTFWKVPLDAFQRLLPFQQDGYPLVCQSFRPTRDQYPVVPSWEAAVWSTGKWSQALTLSGEVYSLVLLSTGVVASALHEAVFSPPFLPWKFNY